MKNLKNVYGKVSFNKKLNAITVIFNGFVPHHDFVNLLEHKYKMLHSYKPKKCLIDIQSIYVFAVGSKEYLNNVWLPYIRDEGIKSVAFIVSDTKFGQILKNVIINDSNMEDIDICFFTDSKQASDWLK